MRHLKNLLVMLAVAIAGFYSAPHALAYCAACQLSLLNSPEGQKLAAGFKDGLLFLLAAPFLVSAVVGLLLLRARRPEPGRLPENPAASEQHELISDCLPR